MKTTMGKLDNCYWWLISVSKSITDVWQMMMLADVFSKIEQALIPLTKTVKALQISHPNIEDRWDFNLKVQQAKDVEVEFKPWKINLNIWVEDLTFSVTDLSNIKEIYWSSFRLS